MSTKKQEATQKSNTDMEPSSFEYSDDSAGSEQATSETTPKQLYRSKASSHVVLELLEREDLTPQDIIDFCQGKKQIRPLPEHSPLQQCRNQERIYRQRYQEIQTLLAKLKTGDARVDEDGRLVAVLDPNAPPAIALPPPPDPAAAAAAAHAGDNAAAEPGLGPGLGPQWLDQEEEDREFIAQGEREAAAAVARTIQRWRDQGINVNNQVELVRIPPHDDNTNLTFRRVCCAVLAVVLAFTAIMLQTLPLSSPSYAHPDQLLGELLHVKTFEQHLQSCPHLHRTENLTRSDGLWEKWGRPLRVDDCADGVLHIPSPQALLEKAISSPSVVPANLAVNGVNVSWFFDCHPIQGQEDSVKASLADSSILSAAAADDDDPDTCSAKDKQGVQCFRGIHDEFLSGREINQALEAGARLVLQGGDHHEVYSSAAMPQKLESIVEKIRNLLEIDYSVRRDIRPVAFRVGAEGPMDGKDVPRIGVQSMGPRPVKLLNLTNYVQYVERVGKRNSFAQFSLPWPLRIQPHRDECHLLADMQADPRFIIHTMIFLADGSGSEFRGGEALYVDDHPSNSNPRRKIRRGLAIDGARGRLVVSTGGLENRRCRLPIRAGVRAALQIWWH